MRSVMIQVPATELRDEVTDISEGIDQLAHRLALLSSRFVERPRLAGELLLRHNDLKRVSRSLHAEVRNLKTTAEKIVA